MGLYRALFAGRSDVYAYRWENTAEGTKGWAPKRRPGTTRDNPEYLPLTDEVISAHLTKENPVACGLYVTLPDSTCRLLVCDFDGGTWRLDAAAYAEAAAWAGVPAAVEISRSGDGAHVWSAQKSRRRHVPALTARLVTASSRAGAAKCVVMSCTLAPAGTHRTHRSSRGTVSTVTGNGLLFRLGVDGQSAMPRAARSPASTRRIVCAVTAPMSARTSSS